MTALLGLIPGLYKNIAAVDYHKRVHGILSKTALDEAERSPGHYKAWLDGVEREETEAMAFGSALHMALLEPDLFARRYMAQPDFGDCRKTDNKARRDAWRVSVGWHEDPAKSRVKILEKPALDAIKGICRSVRSHPLAGKMIADGVAEATLRWTDAESGMECKARVDYYVERLNACFDVKTTEDARPDSFARSMALYRYHVQHAFYDSGFAAIGSPLQNFVFIAVEKRPPYALALYTLRDRDVDLGRRAMRRNINTIAKAIETDTYPMYPETIQTIELPGWYTAREE